jgi:hypothetical protein
MESNMDVAIYYTDYTQTAIKYPDTHGGPEVEPVVVGFKYYGVADIYC